MTESLSGGCQCGAIRFRVQSLGRASLCHCRMCQKATGGIGGLFVDATDLEWTRGAPSYFQSSNLVRRGFCRDCGTPLSFEQAERVDISITAFDRPDDIVPAVRLAPASRLAWFDTLHLLPDLGPEETALSEKWHARIVSRQHPDHDTDDWKPGT